MSEPKFKVFNTNLNFMLQNKNHMFHTKKQVGKYDIFIKKKTFNNKT